MKYKVYAIFFLYGEDGSCNILVGTGPTRIPSRQYWHLPGGTCEETTHLDQLRKECLQEFGDTGRALWGNGTTRLLVGDIKWRHRNTRITVMLVNVKGAFWGKVNGRTPVINGSPKHADPAFTHCCLMPLDEALTEFSLGGDDTGWFLHALQSAERSRILFADGNWPKAQELV